MIEVPLYKFVDSISSFRLRTEVERFQLLVKTLRGLEGAPVDEDVLEVCHHEEGDDRLVQGSGSRVQGSGSRVWGPGSRVQSPGSRVQGPGFRVQGSGFRVVGMRANARASRERRYAVGAGPSDLISQNASIKWF